MTMVKRNRAAAREPSGSTISRRRTITVPMAGMLLLATMLFLACGGGGGTPPAAEQPPTDEEPVLDSHAVAGTVSPPIHAAVDSDVNDPNASYAANDTLEQAQAIFSPVILAGYVNLPGRGAPGRSFSSGDPEDFYRVSLVAGDPIALYISSPQGTDLDLYLYSAEDGLLLDASLGTGAAEALDAPADGDYILGIRIDSQNRIKKGASTYNLIIGGAAAGPASAGFRLSHEFVPGEVILRLRDGDAADTPSSSDPGQAAMFGMTRTGGGNGREMRLTFETGAQTRSVLAALDAGAPMGSGSPATPVSEAGQYKIDTLTIIKALKARSDVQSAEPNWIRRPLRIPNDKFVGLQWHYELLHLPEAWEYFTGNDDVVVAVVDTGVLVNHPDIGGRLTSDGYDFISAAQIEGNEPESESGGIDPNPDDPGDETTGGSSFHGTHVSGTIAAATDNLIGVAGVGWNTARIMPLRALGVGGGTSYDIMQAVRYAAGLPNDSGTLPARPADIINLSLGGAGVSEAEQALYRTISENGIIVVAAAGNEANSQKSYPAAYDGVVSVSAVDYASSIAYYSSFGETIDVAAPGGDNTADLNADGYSDGILSTMGEDTSGTIEMIYGFSQGTSMAAPHVAGIAALMKSVWPAMGYHEFDSLMRVGALTTDLGPAGKDDRYGYGLINAQKAIVAAMGGTAPTILSVSPTVLGFGVGLSSASLRLDILAGSEGTLSVDAIRIDTEWLTVSPDRIDSNGLGVYTVAVDRSGLAGGSYRATITVTSSANTVTVPVSMLVESSDHTADAGYHYVVLLDPATYETRYQVEATPDAGFYRFSFPDVEPGDYLLFAGTDPDNDFVVGDTGEALGAYLSIDQPIVIHVDQDLGELDFRSEFNLSLTDSAPSIQAVRFSAFQRMAAKRVKD